MSNPSPSAVGHDPRAAAPARSEGRKCRLAREVDPDGKLSIGERAILVRNAAKHISAELDAAKAYKCAARRV